MVPMNRRSTPSAPDFNWNVAKTELRFKAIDASSVAAGDFKAVGLAPTSRPQDARFLVEVTLGARVGLLLGFSASMSLRVGCFVHRDFADDAFLATSMAKLTILQANHSVRGRAIPLVVSETLTPVWMKAFLAAGFKSTEYGLRFEPNPETAATLFEMKSYLMSYLRAAPVVGRGSLIDATRLGEEAVSALNQDYQEVAWGATHWARHATISADELRVIDKHCTGEHGLEIGAGFGRVSEVLTARFRELTVTDILPTALEGLRSLLGSRVHVVEDDLLSSALPRASYDVVMFWENGLGAMLTPDSRKLAVKKMCERLKHGGKLIVGVRNLLPIPVDQVMVAAQTNHVMGIYHTFTKAEVLELADPSLELIDFTEGDERPAGGKQLFFVFEKREGSHER
jgi:SAM-dependent methyltransferase